MKTIEEILKGIDQTEFESDDGWWETSVGAEFGRNKKEEIINFIETIKLDLADKN